MAHTALCGHAAFTQAAVSHIAHKTIRPSSALSLVSSFRGFRLGLRPVNQSGRKQVGIVMAEGPTANEALDEQAFVEEKRAKLAARKANSEGGEEGKKPRPPKTPEEKAAYKAHLRRKKLDRKRKLRKLGRWPPLKANVDQPSNLRKRVQKKAK